MRKPVAAIPTETEYGPSVVVICDDGAVFELQEETIKEGRHWKQYPSVPGTQESSDQTKDEFLVLATRFFREHLEASRAEGGVPRGPSPTIAREFLDGLRGPLDDEAVTGPTLEGGAVRHAEAEEEAETGPPAPTLEGEGARIQFREPGPLEQKTAQEMMDAPRFFCGSPKCPGYPFKASTRSHPEDVCGIPERHLDRREPAGAAPADGPPFFCSSPKCQGYPWKASERPHTGVLCKEPGSHLDRPEPPYRGAQL